MDNRSFGRRQTTEHLVDCSTTERDRINCHIRISVLSAAVILGLYSLVYAVAPPVIWVLQKFTGKLFCSNRNENDYGNTQIDKCYRLYSPINLLGRLLKNTLPFWHFCIPLVIVVLPMVLSSILVFKITGNTDYAYLSATVTGLIETFIVKTRKKWR